MSNNAQTTAILAKPDVKDVIHLTARLAQVMAAEVDHLKDMRLKEVDALQSEKLFLTTALDMQKKRLDRHPEFSDTIPSQDKADLQNVLNVFNDVLIENERQLKLAKTVNESVVQAITKVVRDAAKSSVYNEYGVPGASLKPDSLSITLNKTY